MAQIREIKRRIKSINNTAKVTHAMELVAAAKMRKSQQSALSSRPYSTTLDQMLVDLKSKSSSEHTLLQSNDAQDQMVIFLTSDRGLVGGLNMNLFREIAKSELKGVQFVTVGKKGINMIGKGNFEMIASFTSDEQDSLSMARTLAKLVTDAYKNSQVKSVKIVYPNFESTVKQTPKIAQILPIEFANEAETKTTGSESDLLFEPSSDQILENLLPHYVLTKIYQALLEAKASEHSARMVAMKNATDAANDLVSDLTLTYNQARQEAITTELLDIITAQSAFD